MSKGSKIGRNKKSKSMMRYKAENRSAINKAKKIAKHNKRMGENK